MAKKVFIQPDGVDFSAYPPFDGCDNETITDFALTILDDADAATVRATIGAGTSSGITVESSGAEVLSAASILNIVGATVANAGGGEATLTMQGKMYIKDAAGTPHYWQLTVSTLGVLTTTDRGTTQPTDGWVVIP